MPTRWILLLSCFVLVSCDAPVALDSPCDLVIVGVTLIDGTGISARPDSNVCVREGRIAAITSGRFEGKAFSTVPGAGKYLIPGLIDGHAHPFPVDQNFPRFVHYGVTSIFVPGCGVCSDANMAMARSLSESPDRAAPRVFHTSQHFTMEGRHPVKTYPGPQWVEGKTVFYVREVEDVAGYVETVAQQPILGIKVTIEDGPEPPFVELIPTEFVAKIVEEAHGRDLQVFAHVSTMEGVRVAEAAGVDHLIHFVGVDIDWEADREVIDRLQARNPSWVTTLMIDKMFFYPANPEWLAEVEATGQFDSEEIAQLKAGISAEASLARLSAIYDMSDPTLDKVIRPQVEDLRQLHDMGFRLVVGTDTGNDFVFPGLSMHEEMELLAMKFSPAELLPMATRNGAEMLGVLDDLGTLEVGKRADMVLLGQDPLEDIRNTRSIEAVFRDGRQQPR